MSLIERLISGRNDWRVALTRLDADVSTRLTAAYSRTLTTLEPHVTLLETAMAQRQAGGVVVTAQELRDLREFRQLLTRIESEMNDFQTIVRNESALAADGAVQIGADSALEMAANQVGALQAEVRSAWLRPDPDALRRLAGYVDSAAFRANWERLGATTVQQFSDALLSFQAQGKGARQAARFISGWLNIPYAWAENTTRTVGIWSARTAQHATYRANGNVVREWMWWAALDARTCLACIGQHGSLHGLDETLNDHHQGRCTALPIVRGTTWAETVITGPQWFAALPEARRYEQGGAPREMITELANGRLSFADVTGTYQDSVYGEMIRQKSLVAVRS